MTLDAKETQTLLRDLTAAFVERPDALEINFSEHPSGRTYWTMKGHVGDMPRLVGKGGSHVDAIKLLVEQFGRAADLTYLFALLDADPGPSFGESAEKIATEWDPGPTVELLERVLDVLGVGEYKVESSARYSGERDKPRFDLVVHVRDDEDHKLLTVPPELNRKSQPVVTALGTIFRAIAKSEGVRISLEVRRS